MFGIRVVRLCESIADNETFQSFILSLIVLNALSMGVEAIPPLADQYPDLLYMVFCASQAIFVFEIIVRLLAYGANWRQFFKEFWNRFDFIVVALSLLPAIGSIALVARLLRVLRILRILSVSDSLRSFVDGMRSGISTLFFMSVIFLTFGYIWMLAGYYLFGHIDVAYWGNLGKCALTVFSLVLLQDVNTIMESAREISEASVLYFVLFYLSWFYLIAQALRAFNASSSNSGKSAR
jgi:voltage-gated sodium channel